MVINYTWVAVMKDGKHMHSGGVGMTTEQACTNLKWSVRNAIRTPKDVSRFWYMLGPCEAQEYTRDEMMTSFFED